MGGRKDTEREERKRGKTKYLKRRPTRLGRKERASGFAVAGGHFPRRFSCEWKPRAKGYNY